MNRVLPALFCIALLAAAGNTDSRAQTAAQNWPTRPIRLIVPTGPGLGTDIMARLLADGVSRTLGQQIYVENVPGASGITGAQQAARATPDGYTLFFANASTFTSNMFMLKSIPYDPTRDFTAVAMVSNQGPVVVSVYPELPVKTLPELIAYGKAQPGKLSYAVDATSGLGVVAGRLMNKRGGIGMVEVPYRTTAQMMQDTSVGTTQVMISSFAAVDAFARAGKVRRIALSSARRFPGLDDLPTIAETLPGFELDGWLVLVAPAGTPTDIVTQLNRHIGQFLRNPVIQQRLVTLGLAISGTDTAETTAQFIRQQQASWHSLAQEIDLRPE
jgi:tripartite-type tricarboxylate transporter receptor subunit TctC